MGIPSFGRRGGDYGHGDGLTHVTQKSESLKRWQETDPELRDFVLQELHVEAKVQGQLNVKRKRALSVAYCLLIEMAGVS